MNIAASKIGDGCIPESVYELNDLGQRRYQQLTRELLAQGRLTLVTVKQASVAALYYQEIEYQINEALNLRDLVNASEEEFEQLPEHRREQAISFVYGNLAIESDTVTREMVAKAYDDLRDRETNKESTQ